MKHFNVCLCFEMFNAHFVELRLCDYCRDLVVFSLYIEMSTNHCISNVCTYLNHYIVIILLILYDCC